MSTPSNIPALINAGNFAQAALACEADLAANQNLSDAHNYLAYLHMREGNFDKAAHHGQKASEANPASAPILVNYARTLSASKRHDEALAALDRAMTLQRGWPEPFTLGAELLNERGLFYAAAARCRKGIALAPADFDLHFVLAESLLSLTRANEAISILTAWRHKRPTDFRLASNLAHYWNFVSPPAPAAGEPLTLAHCSPDQAPVFAAHKSAGQTLIRGQPPAYRPALPLNPAAPEISPQRTRLRIGIISPDLRDHSVGFFIAPLFEHRRRESTELFAYYTATRRDHITRRLESLADHWRSAESMSRDALAKQLAADRLDVLIELPGHTRGQVLDIARCKLAAHTVTYLGYPNTTGVPGIQYRIVDSITDPPGIAESLATERLLRLDPCFLCYAPPPDAPPVSPLPALANDFITFGSFNNLRKLNPITIALWADVLLAVPTSKLLLKAQGLAEQETAEMIAAQFASRGIPQDRLTLTGYIDDPQGHLGAYRLIDIALDPLPYNGTTTTCEAMHMGVPTITLTGNCHSARVGTSLLTAVGLPQCIAQTPTEFVEIAAKLASNPQALSHLRATLRTRMSASPLCDGPNFAHRLEKLLRAATEPST